MQKDSTVTSFEEHSTEAFLFVLKIAAASPNVLPAFIFPTLLNINLTKFVS